MSGHVREIRVERTFAFVDLSGFTSYTAERGDNAAVDVLSIFRRAVRDTCAARGVRVAKWLGDGAMLVSVEAEALAEAVVEISEMLEAESALPLRSGVASGPVILFEGDDYIGSTVNLASRLCDMAGPGQVLAPANFLSSLMVNTEAVPVGSIEIKGLHDPTQVVELHSR